MSSAYFLLQIYRLYLQFKYFYLLFKDATINLWIGKLSNLTDEIKVEILRKVSLVSNPKMFKY